MSECRDKLFAAGVHAGLLIDPSCKELVQNRWGSMSAPLAQECLGMFYHNTLGEAAKSAFPRYVDKQSEEE